MKIFTQVVIGTVILIVIGALFVVGSPAKERLRRFDDIRIQHLSFLQSEILYYRDLHKGQIPQTIDLLNDDVRGVRVPIDPTTREPYTYEVVSSSTIQLCATFALASEESFPKPEFYPTPVYFEASWEHPAGYHCFERKFPPYVEPPSNIPDKSLIPRSVY